MSTVLIIEDDTNLSKIMRSYLERENYEVLTSFRGDTGLEIALLKNPDLILLDLNLPGLDGMDVASELQKIKDIPIIMVTSRVEESDRLLGLNSGADDYISKPFSPRELVARVRVVLRRAGKENQQSEKICIGDLEIDAGEHTASVSGQLLDLTPTEYSLFFKLASNPGRVFSRQQLIENLKSDQFNAYERSIDVHIKNLRNKLGKSKDGSKLIETVFGIGYRFKREK
jgi:DNA-binding response OmpR family regulator